MSRLSDKKTCVTSYNKIFLLPGFFTVSVLPNLEDRFLSALHEQLILFCTSRVLPQKIITTWVGYTWFLFFFCFWQRKLEIIVKFSLMENSLVSKHSVCPYIFLCRVLGQTEWSVRDFVSDWLVGDIYTRWQLSQWSLKCYLRAYLLSDFRLPLRCIRYLRSFGILRNVELSFRTKFRDQLSVPSSRIEQSKNHSSRSDSLSRSFGTEHAILVCVKSQNTQISYLIWRCSFVDFEFKPNYCFVITSS